MGVNAAAHLSMTANEVNALNERVIAWNHDSGASTLTKARGGRGRSGARSAGGDMAMRMIMAKMGYRADGDGDSRPVGDAIERTRRFRGADGRIAITTVERDGGVVGAYHDAVIGGTVVSTELDARQMDDATTARVLTKSIRAARRTDAKRMDVSVAHDGDDPLASEGDIVIGYGDAAGRITDIDVIRARD
jgi:hypothetical protein